MAKIRKGRIKRSLYAGEKNVVNTFCSCTASILAENGTRPQNDSGEHEVCMNTVCSSSKSVPSPCLCYATPNVSAGPWGRL